MLGRGETQPPADPDRSPVALPDGRPVTADDLRGLRISVTVRGYRMTEVDWLLEQLAHALEERDGQITTLRSRLAEAGAARRTRGPDDAGSAGGGEDAGA
ncbi:DivIVA domain-containing protein [Geodermatophilus sp. TF02-6]|nr:DivIVA domain-containing protein [Geodermatophilus sp. TF02-6]